MLLRPTNRAQTAPLTLRSVVYSSSVSKLMTAALLLALLLSPITTVYGNETDTASSSPEVVETETQSADEETTEATKTSETKSSNQDSSVENQEVETNKDATEPDLASSSKEIVAATTSKNPDTASASSSDLIINEEGANTSPATSLQPPASTTEDQIVPAVAGTSTASNTAVASNSATTSDDSDTDSEAVETSVDTNASTTVTASTTHTTNSNIASSTANDEPVLSETDETVTNSEVENTSPETTANTDVETSASSSDSNLSNLSTDSQLNYINNENRYQFAEQECVAVESGAYYCQTKADKDASEDRTSSVVEAKVAASGYPNIYLNAGDKTLQITDNQYEDSAPHYDAVSNSIVWQRLVEGRYQIIAYDIATQKESILTNSSHNNMQPVRSGEVTVWQRWSQDAWQVMLLEANEIKQISFNSYHNLAPYVSGDYIIWNIVKAGDGKKIAVYEISTGNLEYIDDPEGGRVTNPRFVLMYDTTFANGDVVTKGFDPETGTVVPLSAQPAAPAPDIPSSDPVGETRALLNTKSNNEEDDDMPTVTNKTATSSQDTASSTETDLNLAVATTSNNAATSTELTDWDLPIAPYAGSSTSNTASSSASSTQSDNS